jgi:hypothetical protein
VAKFDINFFNPRGCGNGRTVVVIFLVTFVVHVAMLTPFGIFRVPFFREVILSVDGKYEFLSAINAN